MYTNRRNHYQQIEVKKEDDMTDMNANTLKQDCTIPYKGKVTTEIAHVRQESKKQKKIAFRCINKLSTLH